MSSLFQNVITLFTLPIVFVISEVCASYSLQISMLISVVVILTSKIELDRDIFPTKESSRGQRIFLMAKSLRIRIYYMFILFYLWRRILYIRIITLSGLVDGMTNQNGSML